MQRIRVRHGGNYCQRRRRRCWRRRRWFLASHRILRSRLSVATSPSRNCSSVWDKVLTARGTWKTVTNVTSRDWHSMMMDMGDGELTTQRHSFLDINDPAKPWKRAMDLHPEFPLVPYHGTVHNVHVECEDDGTSANTEHSYTLANGSVVHNFLPT